MNVTQDENLSSLSHKTNIPSFSLILVWANKMLHKTNIPSFLVHSGVGHVAADLLGLAILVVRIVGGSSVNLLSNVVNRSCAKRQNNDNPTIVSRTFLVLLGPDSMAQEMKVLSLVNLLL
jgi:hypothetical protein